MNYIILSDSAINSIREKYVFYENTYGYAGTLDSHILECLTFQGRYKVLNRCRNEQTYYLIGKNCILNMEKHSRYANCFYGKKIKFFEDEAEYLSKLTQTLELPGEWEMIGCEETYRIHHQETESIDKFLSGINPSYKEFYEFEENWKTWDFYNSKLRERQQKKEEESECLIEEVLVEHNIFLLRLNVLKKEYQEDTELCVQFAGEDRFQLLGKILSADAKKCRIKVCCENTDFIKAYIEGKTSQMIKTRIIDFGTLARLKRQREAMKKLFQNESANPNLKDILMGDHDFTSEKQGNFVLADALHLFGSNVRMKEAYIGALNAENLYLIQGPPGTGKTTIITELVRHVIGQGKKMLVSSETNIAVDNVLERIHHMQQVIPVRLGREERMTPESVSYMPEKIADALVAHSQKQLLAMETNGMQLEQLLLKCEAEWNQKISQLGEAISKKKEHLPNNWDEDMLFQKIDAYEGLVIEMNEMYAKLLQQKKEYLVLKEEQSALQQKKHELDSLKEIMKDGSMRSGLKEADAVLEKNNRKYTEESAWIPVRLAHINGKLQQNQYELLLGSYQRKYRRYKRETSQLEPLGIPGMPLNASLYTIKNVIQDIRILQEQKENDRKICRMEMEKIKADFTHKQELWEKSKDIRRDWLEVSGHLNVKKEIERLYMKQTNVVFATCTGIASSDNGSFAEMEYDYVVIDEAAKCNMLDLLIPLVLGKKIILVGDHKQLYPMLETDQIKNEITEQQIDMLKEHILFKWLYEERVPEEKKSLLKHQYRMPYTVSEFVSAQFYEGQLSCEKVKKSQKEMFWIDSEQSEEFEVGTSFENPKEAELIVSLLRKLDAEYKSPTEVGVICIYKPQAERISEMLKKENFSNIQVECSTVDSFQGKEKHTIIFNIVKTKNTNKFMRDHNRVNVAVSRTQEVLYVVGRADLMKTKDADCLGELYRYIKSNGDIYSSRFVR